MLLHTDRETRGLSRSPPSERSGPLETAAAARGSEGNFRADNTEIRHWEQVDGVGVRTKDREDVGQVWERPAFVCPRPCALSPEDWSQLDARNRCLWEHPRGHVTNSSLGATDEAGCQAQVWPRGVACPPLPSPLSRLKWGHGAESLCQRRATGARVEQDCPPRPRLL